MWPMKQQSIDNACPADAIPPAVQGRDAAHLPCSLRDIHFYIFPFCEHCLCRSPKSLSVSFAPVGSSVFKNLAHSALTAHRAPRSVANADRMLAYGLSPAT